MQNPIKLLVNFFKRIFRKRQVKKREAIYDDVIKKLSPIVEEKEKKQLALIKELQINYYKLTGCQYGSKFIPVKFKNEIEAREIILAKYGDRMKTLNVGLTMDLKFICT